MIITAYRSPVGGTDRGARMVRRNAIGSGYRWCEQSSVNPRYDVAQGTCEASDLPDDVRAAADALQGQFFGYVRWPE